jgi:hypothetical protein
MAPDDVCPAVSVVAELLAIAALAAETMAASGTLVTDPGLVGAGVSDRV